MNRLRGNGGDIEKKRTENHHPEKSLKDKRSWTRKARPGQKGVKSAPSSKTAKRPGHTRPIDSRKKIEHQKGKQNWEFSPRGKQSKKRKTPRHIRERRSGATSIKAVGF